MSVLRLAALLASVCLVGCGRPTETQRPTAAAPVPAAVAAPTFELRGRMTDSNGRPCAGAILFASPAPAFKGCPDARREAETQVSDDGEFAFAGLEAGDWAVLCSKDGAVRAPTGTVRVPDVRRFDVDLPLGATIAGRLVDDEGDQPVAGAKVSGLSIDGQTVVVATTDSDGKFEATTHRDATRVAKFRIESPGRQSRAVGCEIDAAEPIGEGERLDVELRAMRGVRLRGYVTGPAGPVGAASVTVWLDHGDGEPAQRFATETDHDGRYELRSLDHGTATVRVESAGLVQAEARRPELADEEGWPTSAPDECRVGVPEEGAAEHDVSLTHVRPWSTCTAKGRVVDEEGKPVAGAVVASRGGAPRVETLTGADGAFTLAGVSTDGATGEVVAFRDGFESETQYAQAEAGGTADDVDITLARMPRVHGSVRTASGEPVPGARVLVVAHGDLVHGTSAAPGEVGVVEVRTDASGAYAALIARREDSIAVHVDAPGFAAGRVYLPSDEGRADFEADVVLVPPTTLVGRVVEAREARPVAGALLVLVESPAGDSTDDAPCDVPAPVRAVSAADGTFRIDGLAPGKFTVEVRGAAWLRAGVEFELPRVAPLVVEVRTSLALDGRATWADGAPAADVSVSVYSAPPDSVAGVAPLAPPRTTQRDGRFLFRGLAPGGYWLSFEGGDPAIRSTVVGPVSAGTPAIPVRVEPGLAITGSVAAPHRSMLDHVEVWATRSGQPSARRHVVNAASDGSFELTGLGDESYDVHVVAAECLLLNVTDVHAGGDSLELKLELALAIEGVLLSPDGTPLGSVRVTARPADPAADDPDWAARATQTDDDGAFRVGSLARGRWRIVLDEPSTYAGPRPADDAVFEAGDEDVRVRCVAPSTALRRK